MTKLLKLKNKPFWIAAAVILIVGIAFYKQRRTEGFETKFNHIGALWYGKIKDLDDNFFTDANGFVSVVDAEDGKELWKKGDSRPKSSDNKYYILKMAPSSYNSSISYKDIESTESMAKSGPNKAVRDGYVCAVVLDGNRYRDKDGNKIIDAWMNIFGSHILKTTFYWIMGGIGALVFLIILFMMMRNSGGGGNSLNRNNNS